jgi:hypothetical protein
MGSQVGYRGRIGNVIHYKMGKKFYTRSAPKKYEQTEASKAAAKIFGKASAIGALVRGDLSSVIPSPSDRKMHGRLLAKIFEWLQIVNNDQPQNRYPPNLESFDSLNLEAPSLESRWRVKAQVTNLSPGVLEIKIPALVPKKAFIAPEGAVEVICKIATAVTDIHNVVSIGRFSTEIIYPLDEQEVPEQTISIELPMPEGSLVVTALALEYSEDRYKRRRIITNNLYLPSKIIHSIYL